MTFINSLFVFIFSLSLEPSERVHVCRPCIIIDLFFSLLFACYLYAPVKMSNETKATTETGDLSSNFSSDFRFRLSLSCRELATEGSRDNDSVVALFVPITEPPQEDNQQDISTSSGSSSSNKIKWEILDVTELIKFSNNPDYIKTFPFIISSSQNNENQDFAPNPNPESVNEYAECYPTPQILKLVVFDLGLCRSYTQSERNRQLGICPHRCYLFYTHPVPMSRYVSANLSFSCMYRSEEALSDTGSARQPTTHPSSQRFRSRAPSPSSREQRLH